MSASARLAIALRDEEAPVGGGGAWRGGKSGGEEEGGCGNGHKSSENLLANAIRLGDGMVLLANKLEGIHHSQGTLQR